MSRPKARTAEKDWAVRINAFLDNTNASEAVWSELLAHEESALLENVWREDDPQTAMAKVFKLASEKADKGDIAFLRKVTSYIAGEDMSRFLKPPHKGRGKKFPKITSAMKAARDYKTVRIFFKGKENQPRTNTIKQVVATRHNVHINSVEDQLDDPKKLFGLSEDGVSKISPLNRLFKSV